MAPARVCSARSRGCKESSTTLQSTWMQRGDDLQSLFLVKSSPRCIQVDCSVVELSLHPRDRAEQIRAGAIQITQDFTQAILKLSQSFFPRVGLELFGRQGFPYTASLVFSGCCFPVDIIYHTLNLLLLLASNNLTLMALFS